MDMPNIAINGLGNANTYSGMLNSDGTWAKNPAVWNAARTGIGAYTITHNMGTTNYGVNVTSPTGNPQVVTCDANSVYLQCYDGNGNPIDAQVAISVSVFTPSPGA